MLFFIETIIMVNVLKNIINYKYPPHPYNNINLYLYEIR